MPLPVGELPGSGTETPSTNVEVPSSALVIAAHPDDAEFGCGGTLAKWSATGCAVHHLVLTDGSKGTWDPGRDDDELVALRRREQERAAELLGGGRVRFAGWVDGELQSGIDERHRVCEVIREIKPDVVLGHDPWRRYRLHPDHRHAGWLTVDAVVAARDPKFFPDITDGAHRPRALLLWEADQPNHVEDVPVGAVEAKIAALLAHESQYLSTMGIGASDPVEGRRQFSERVRTQLASHGSLAGLGAGEAFRLLTGI